jgi:hypothetical protein
MLLRHAQKDFGLLAWCVMRGVWCVMRGVRMTMRSIADCQTDAKLAWRRRAMRRVPCKQPLIGIARVE